eukprot:TRINITY_DN13452_c0_g1_i1.p1 TRINITY_DN13452_c0_g1~~TRINITY_DN13452_c0_g1_i1.p1  ORF type:complete len:970 (+),score=181.70 TRINITY_DN13452_c0_g1_i1:88-2997(+)
MVNLQEDAGVAEAMVASGRGAEAAATLPHGDASTGILCVGTAEEDSMTSPSTSSNQSPRISKDSARQRALKRPQPKRFSATGRVTRAIAKSVPSGQSTKGQKQTSVGASAGEATSRSLRGSVSSARSGVQGSSAPSRRDSGVAVSVPAIDGIDEAPPPPINFRALHLPILEEEPPLGMEETVQQPIARTKSSCVAGIMSKSVAAAAAAAATPTATSSVTSTSPTSVLGTEGGGLFARRGIMRQPPQVMIGKGDGFTASVITPKMTPGNSFRPGREPQTPTPVAMTEAALEKSRKLIEELSMLGLWDETAEEDAEADPSELAEEEDDYGTSENMVSPCASPTRSKRGFQSATTAEVPLEFFRMMADLWELMRGQQESGDDSFSSCLAPPVAMRSRDPVLSMSAMQASALRSAARERSSTAGNSANAPSGSSCDGTNFEHDGGASGSLASLRSAVGLGGGSKGAAAAAAAVAAVLARSASANSNGCPAAPRSPAGVGSLNRSVLGSRAFWNFLGKGVGAAGTAVAVSATGGDADAGGGATSSRSLVSDLTTVPPSPVEGLSEDSISSIPRKLLVGARSGSRSFPGDANVSKRYSAELTYAKPTVDMASAAIGTSSDAVRVLQPCEQSGAVNEDECSATNPVATYSSPVVAFDVCGDDVARLAVKSDGESDVVTDGPSRGPKMIVDCSVGTGASCLVAHKPGFQQGFSSPSTPGSGFESSSVLLGNAAVPTPRNASGSSFESSSVLLGNAAVPIPRNASGTGFESSSVLLGNAAVPTPRSASGSGVGRFFGNNNGSSIGSGSGMSTCHSAKPWIFPQARQQVAAGYSSPPTCPPSPPSPMPRICLQAQAWRSSGRVMPITANPTSLPSSPVISPQTSSVVSSPVLVGTRTLRSPCSTSQQLTTVPRTGATSMYVGSVTPRVTSRSLQKSSTCDLSTIPRTVTTTTTTVTQQVTTSFLMPPGSPSSPVLCLRS